MCEYSVTKQVLAYAVKRLMREQPLSKITVGDICEACGMNRKSFYYHFHDKYDLVNWIFSTELKENIEEKQSSAPNDALLRLCLFFKKQKEFYRAALQGEGQDSLYSYLMGVIRPVVAGRLQGNVLHDPDADFYTDLLTRQYRNAIVGWVREGCTVEPERFVTMLYRAARLGGRIAPETGLADDRPKGNVVDFPPLKVCGK